MVIKRHEKGMNVFEIAEDLEAEVAEVDSVLKSANLK